MYGNSLKTGRRVVSFGVLIGLLTFGTALAQTTEPPADQRPVSRDMTRGKFWLNEAWENNVGIPKAGTYPGYHETNNHVLHNQTAFFLDAKTADQDYHNWPRGSVAGWCTTPQQLVKNYNFTLSLDEAEEYTVGRCHTYDSDTEDEFIPLYYEVYTKRMVWSLPRYDDFVIWEMVVKNTDERAWEDAFIGYNFVVDPSGAGDNRFSNDNEYVWAGDLKTYGDEQGAFIFYDDNSWPGFSESPAVYLYPPGNETGDRGDPGNILEANSVDRRLYSPQAVAIGFIDADPNQNGEKKFWYSIRNSEGEQPWSHQNAPSHERVVWAMSGYEESVGVMTDDAPRMSWQEAHDQGNPTAGNTWERSPLLTIAIGPYDLAPGDSIQFKMLFVGGELDRNIAMRGGIKATSLLPEAAIEDVKDNWASAIELIENDYRPLAYPPPTPGNVPRENHGNELEVDIYAEQDEGGQPTQGYIIRWTPVASDYRDPKTGIDDFVGYRVYQSIIGVEGPWDLVTEVSREEAAGLMSNGRVTLKLPSEPGIPSRFAVTTIDAEELESGRTAYTLDPLAAPRAPSNDLTKTLVVPNPFRQVSGLLDAGEEKRLEIVGIPARCTIRIYTMAGEIVQTIDHDGFGSEAWGSSTGDNNNYMLTQWATNVAPGIYLYHITSQVPGHEGETAIGKFAILK